MASETTVVSVNIGIDNASRAKIADGLSRLLADTYTLYLKTHNFHSLRYRPNVPNIAFDV